MARQPPEDPAPTPPPEVIAKNQRLKEDRQSPDPQTRKAASRETKRRSSSVSSTPSAGAAEDGYSSSSSSSSSVDERTPSQIYEDLKRSSNGGPANGNGTASGTSTTSEPNVPAHLRAEQHEMIVYLAGNSLGLQSKTSAHYVQEELSVWQDKAVSGWFSHHYKRPWKTYAEKLSPMIAGLVGAKEVEVASMGNLTTNLHLLLCSFYRPTKQRYKILFEAKAFPSDHYAFASQVEMHGYKKENGLVTVKPREGEYTLSTEDILKAIEEEGDEVAVVFFSGVNYFSGQVFEIEKITAAAHKKGCLVGWDLAHGIGNILLQLHDWDADFAVWCTYKYLNSGPGGIAGLYVHEKHSDRPRLAGWWGNKIDTRFAMAETFDPAPGAAGFQTSTPSIISLASLLGSLESILLCGKEDSAQQESPASTSIAIKKMRKKSMLITAYLHILLKASRYYVPLSKMTAYESTIGEHWKDPKGKAFRPGFTVITPEDPEARGAQLSILLLPRNIGMLPPTMHHLEAAGVFGDEREPDVIRFAPVPMYVSYKDCWQASQTFDWALKCAAYKVQGKKPKRGRSTAALH